MSIFSVALLLPDISPPALSMAGGIILFLIAIQRLMGMLLTTIAVEMFVKGIKQLFL